METIENRKKDIFEIDEVVRINWEKMLINALNPIIKKKRIKLEDKMKVYIKKDYCKV